MNKSTLAIVVGVAFVIFGGFYLLAAMGVAFDQLSDSAGGPWLQGLGACALGLAAIGWGIAKLERKRPPKPKTEYQVGIKHH